MAEYTAPSLDSVDFELEEYTTPSLDAVNFEFQPNSAPDAPSNPSPSDGATGVSTSTTLSVDVSDPDGDSMDVSFYWDDGTLIETVTGVSSGGTAETSALSLNEDTTYNWYAVADDGSATTQSSTWSFTTLESPSVNTDSATNVDSNSATLNGELTSLGSASDVDVWFKYRKEATTTREKGKRRTREILEVA